MVAGPELKSVPPNRYAVFFGIAACGLFLDLWTKRVMFDWLGMPPGPTHWLWPEVFGFQTSLNEGALFGLGQGWRTVFISLSFLAAGAILFILFVRRAAHDLLFTVALACITGGILGNLYDRLGLPGLVWNTSNPPLHEVGDTVRGVRDWVRVVIVHYDWPNFNIADSLLVCGTGLLFWQMWRTDRPSPSATGEGEPPSKSR